MNSLFMPFDVPVKKQDVCMAQPSQLFLLNALKSLRRSRPSNPAELLAGSPFIEALALWNKLKRDLSVFRSRNYYSYRWRLAPRFSALGTSSGEERNQSGFGALEARILDLDSGFETEQC
ncbi:hypothetical protein MHYP_G00072310 [Metynnis hypsauchen]